VIYRDIVSRSVDVAQFIFVVVTDKQTDRQTDEGIVPTANNHNQSKLKSMIYRDIVSWLVDVAQFIFIVVVVSHGHRHHTCQLINVKMILAARSEPVFHLSTGGRLSIIISSQQSHYLSTCTRTINHL